MAEKLLIVVFVLVSLQNLIVDDLDLVRLRNDGICKLGRCVARNSEEPTLALSVEGFSESLSILFLIIKLE